MAKRKQHPAWKLAKPAKGPTGLQKIVAGAQVLQADHAYGKAVKTGNRKAVASAAAKMRTAQRRAGVGADPKLVSIGEAVRARAAYDKAVASGNAAAIRKAATKLQGIQSRAGVDQARDGKGRFA